MSDHYRKLARMNGQIQVVGDTAIRVDQSGNPVEYTEKGYSVAEEINLGLGGRFEIPAATSPTASNVVAIPSPSNVALPFMTMRMTVPSSVALYLMVTNAKIAAVDLIDGDAICADVFSEVSLNNSVRWPTANTGQQIGLQMGNTDTASGHEPRVSLTGIRLR